MKKASTFFQGKTILVTGGAGFIGSTLIDRLLTYDVKRIITFDKFLRGRRENLIDAQKSGKVDVVKADIRSNDLDRFFKGVDYVYHLTAIRLTLCAEDPRLCHEVMVDGTFNVLEQCVRHKVKKIIFPSSAEVYGEPFVKTQGKPFLMSESHPFNTTTSYGAAKLAGEYMVRAFHKKYGLPYTILRYFNAYGPRMDIYSDQKEVIIKFIESIKEGKAPMIFGDGKNAMDFTYIDDIINATILATVSTQPTSVYNIGTGKPTSLASLASKLPRLLRVPKSPKPILTPSSRPQVQSRIANITKAQKELGYSPSVTINQGLKQLIDWYDSVSIQNHS